jgi:hypothetical protein
MAAERPPPVLDRPLVDLMLAPGDPLGRKPALNPQPSDAVLVSGAGRVGLGLLRVARPG